jgi:uroporphyrinogen-III synthase
VVTSANGASALARELGAQNKEMEASPQIAAVGMATADALPCATHARRTIVPEIFSARQMALRLGRHVAGKRVLLVQGTSAAPALQEALFAAGAHVERVDAYRSVAPADLGQRIAEWLSENKTADAVTFTSAQMALNFFRALESKQAVLAPTTMIASIGPVTSRALRDMGRAPQVEAKAARMEDLAAALGAFFALR